MQKKKSEKITIGGWTVPGGKAGIAVRKACELITINPGISQAALLNIIVEYSGMNRAHATWITSPDAKRPDRSPTEKLWTREKDGRGFRCYPNAFTPQLSGAHEALKAYRLEEVRKQFLLEGGLPLPAPGSRVVVKVVGYDGMETRSGIFLGVTWWDNVDSTIHSASTAEELMSMMAADEIDPVPRSWGGCHVLFDGDDTPRWTDARRIPAQNISPEV